MKDVIFCEKELKNNRIIIHKYDTKEQLDGIKNKGEYYYTRVGTMVVVRDVAKDKLVDASTLYDIRGLRYNLSPRISYSVLASTNLSFATSLTTTIVPTLV